MREKILEVLNSIRPGLDYAASNNFIEDGYLDSFDMASLVSALDEAFEISISIDDIESLANIDNISEVINKIKG
jgi:acyl carrier protein